MINITKVIDYLLIYFLIAFSGVPFFYKAHIAMLIIFIAFPLVVFIIRKRKIDKFIIYYAVVVLVIQAGQMLKFYNFPALTFMGLHARLIFAYLTIRAVGERTIDYYVDILVFSVVTSLLFYIPSYFGGFERFMENNVAPHFNNPFIKDSRYVVWPNLILYTINPKGEGLIWLKRNSGPFWEPGAFAGFLTIALLFHMIRTGKLFEKKNNILMLGIVTTFSTAGLLVLAFVITVYFSLSRNILRRIIILPIIIIASMILFNTIDFLGAKVVSKMEYTGETYNTRFKSAWLDLTDFSENPFFGLGRSETTRFKGETRGRVIHRNNGVTNQLAMYGLIAFVMYFFFTYKTFRTWVNYNHVDKRMAFYALIGVLLIGFSEVYFTKVFFISLTMMHLLYVDKEISDIQPNEIDR